jgi:hypothetical protein
MTGSFLLLLALQLLLSFLFGFECNTCASYKPERESYHLVHGGYLSEYDDLEDEHIQRLDLGKGMRGAPFAVDHSLGDQEGS